MAMILKKDWTEDFIDDFPDKEEDDIYIMMQCLFVCHEKWALSEKAVCLFAMFYSHFFKCGK